MTNRASCMLDRHRSQEVVFIYFQRHNHLMLACIRFASSWCYRFFLNEAKGLPFSFIKKKMISLLAENWPKISTSTLTDPHETRPSRGHTQPPRLPTEAAHTPTKWGSSSRLPTSVIIITLQWLRLPWNDHQGTPRRGGITKLRPAYAKQVAPCEETGSSDSDDEL
jgi:hypothetical protein